MTRVRGDPGYGSPKERTWQSRIPSDVQLFNKFGIASAVTQNVMYVLRTDGSMRAESGMEYFVENP